MNIYQCEEKAKDIGFDKAKFVAFFPAGPKKCKWLDAYMGLLEVDADGLRGSFLTTKQVDQMFPELITSEPYVEEAD